VAEGERPEDRRERLTRPSPRELLRAAAPWLFAPELGACIVGSAALAEACRRAGFDGPRVGDVDLAWLPDVEQGAALLAERGVLIPTTGHNRARGTLAAKLAGTRVELTTLRGGASHMDLAERIERDLAARESTAGALAWRLDDDVILDPQNGLADWRARLVRAAGDPLARVREHPIRWVRWYRRAHEWGFTLDGAIRKVAADPAWLREVPAEALAQELRAILLRCPSPGRCLLELHEAKLLAVFAPELAPQFDGRPAGPQRHHPEVSQALHLVLALEAAQRLAADRSDEDRAAVLVATLCHDLGKNSTRERDWPRHLGHEAAGGPLIDAMFARLPGLGDAALRRLAHAVARLHLVIRDVAALRPGTLADLYDEWFRPADFRADLFALAVAADVAGRSGREAEGPATRAQIERDVAWIRERCEGVDARALRAQHPEVERFREALREARARALRG